MTNTLASRPYDFNPDTMLERALDMYTQKAFADGFEGLRQHDLYGMPDLVAGLNHEADITPYPTEQFEHGFFVPDATAERWAYQGLPSRIHFTPQPLKRLGRGDSRRTAFFGVLEDQYFHGDDHSATAQVAVKAYSADDETYAFQEYAMHNYLEELGIPTFRTLGMLALDPSTIAAGPRLFLITEFNPNVTTMDNINWDTLNTEQRWGEINRAVRTLAMIHGELVFHGDFRPKNVAFDQAGNPVVIDTEIAVSALYNAHPSGTQDKILEAMRGDFDQLCEAVNTIILDPRNNPELSEYLSKRQKFDQHLEHIFIPYFEYLTQSGAVRLDVLHKVFAKMIKNMEAELPRRSRVTTK